MLNALSCKEHPDVLEAHRLREVQKGRLVTIGPTLPEAWKGSAYVSPIGIIPKPHSKKFRCIFNLSSGGVCSINERIPQEDGIVPFLSNKEIAQALAEAGAGAWLAAFDVEEAFRHLPVAPSDYRLLLLLIHGVYYVDTRVGFGSRTGPANYQKFGAALAFLLEKSGLTLLRIIDDHLLISTSRAGCAADVLRAHRLLAELGVPRAPLKDFGPATWAIFNGLYWNCLTQRVGIAPTRLLEIIADLGALLAHAPGARTWHLNELRTTVGRLTSLLAVVPEGKAFLQACYAASAEAVASLRQRTGRSASQREPKGSGLVAVKPNFAAIWEIRWWHDRLATGASPTRAFAQVALHGCQFVAPLPMRNQGPVTLSCDASGTALGAVWGNRWVRVPVTATFRLGRRAALHDRSRAQPGRGRRSGSTLLETAAILLALATWGHQLANTEVVILSDNSGAVAAWARLHSSHPVVAGFIRAAMALVLRHNIKLSVKWIAGATNVYADAVSRSKDELFRRLVRPRTPKQDRAPINPLTHPWWLPCTP